MAYRLDLRRRDAGDAVRRCGRRQIKQAIRKLDGFGEDPVTATHEARKHVKKARSVLRLARLGTGREPLNRENALLRKAGEQLSAVRDTHVATATLDQIAEELADPIYPSQLVALRERMTVAQASELPAAGDPGEAVAAASDLLQEAIERSAEWPLDGCDWPDLIDGAKKIYRRGRNQMRRLGPDPDAERLHEWRKQVKHHLHTTRLFMDLWPAVMEVHAAETRRLAEQLGDNHDLYLLAGRLTRIDTHAEPIDRLITAIESRRAAIQAEALPLGALIYAEKPGAYSRRLTAWATHRRS